VRPKRGDVISRGCADLLIFMDLDASGSQIDAVAASLNDDPQVFAFSYLDRNGAAAEFSSMFGGPGGGGPTLPVAEIPTSYHVLLKQGADRVADRVKYRAQPGVREALAP